MALVAGAAVGQVLTVLGHMLRLVGDLRLGQLGLGQVHHAERTEGAVRRRGMQRGRMVRRHGGVQQPAFHIRLHRQHVNAVADAAVGRGGRMMSVGEQFE